MSSKPQQRIPSGSKFTSDHGIRAIKDGVKQSSREGVNEVLRKPKWLRARMPGGERFDAVRENVREH